MLSDPARRFTLHRFPNHHAGKRYGSRGEPDWAERRRLRHQQRTASQKHTHGESNVNRDAQGCLGPKHGKNVSQYSYKHKYHPQAHIVLYTGSKINHIVCLLSGELHFFSLNILLKMENYKQITLCLFYFTAYAPNL